jgi:hypothetical protein
MKEALVKNKNEMKFLKNVKVKTDYSGDSEALLTAVLTRWSSTVSDIADDVSYSKDMTLSQLSKLEEIAYEISRVRDRIAGEVE